MHREHVKEFLILTLCIATFCDSAFFNNAAGLPLDLILDSLLVLDFIWKICRSPTYWRAQNYHVLLDVSMILLIVSYTVVEIRYEKSFEGLDDTEAVLLLLRFGTRLIYTCRSACGRRLCKKSHAKVASEDYSIAPLLEEGEVWALLAETHQRVSRALNVEDAVVLHRSRRDFSFETLMLHTATTTVDTPCVLWLRSGTRLIGFYRERPWKKIFCDSAPSLMVASVQNNQYDFLPGPCISFVKCSKNTLTVATDTSSYVFEGTLQTLTERDENGTTTLHNINDVEVLSYRRAQSLHLTPV